MCIEYVKDCWKAILCVLTGKMNTFFIALNTLFAEVYAYIILNIIYRIFISLMYTVYSICHRQSVVQLFDVC